MALMPKLAVVLWQLPAQLPANLDLLDHVLVSLAAWPEARHAIEFRNQSWLSDDVATRLARAQIIAVQSDAPDWPLWDKVTTDTVYVRMHGHTRLYRSEYTPKALQRWADRIRHWCTEDRTVHVYFDNTDEGAAPVDGRRLRELVGV